MFKNHRQLELDLRDGKEEPRGAEVLRDGLARTWGGAVLRGETKHVLDLLLGIVF